MVGDDPLRGVPELLREDVRQSLKTEDKDKKSPQKSIRSLRAFILFHSLEMITPRIMMATPRALRLETVSARIRTPITTTQTKLVAVIQGITDTGTWIRATWLITRVEKRSP